MSSVMLRKINDSIGLTVLGATTGSDTAYSTASWATILEVTEIPKRVLLTGIRITNTGTPTDPVYRIVGKKNINDSYKKLAPYDDSQIVATGEDEEFAWPVSVPAGGSYAIQIYCSAANSATATGKIYKMEIENI